MTAPHGAGAAQERNARAVDQLETEASQSVRAAIGGMLAEVLAAIEDTSDDDGGGGQGEAPNADVVAAAARRAWTRVVDRIVDWVRSTFRQLVTRAGNNLPDTVTDGPADDGAPDLPGETVEQRVQALTEQVRARLDAVPDVVASRVTTQLQQGYARGESPAELRRRVAEVLDRDEWDAEVERIARTTTTSVYNAAHSAAADQLEADLGEPLRRMWLATRDTRTRPTHREANGQIVESGESFAVGDARLRFPGDPLGPVEEIVNCRCVVLPVVDDLVIDLAHRVQGKEAAVLDENDQPIAAAAAAVEEGGMSCPCEGPVDEETTRRGEPAVAVTAVTLEETRTMAMLALIPSEQDAARLAVDGDGAVPAGELHVTLAFLGDGQDWAGTEAGERVVALAETIGQDTAPITVYAWATGVTEGDSATGATPFYVVSDDTGRLAELQGGVLMAGAGWIPAQHSPFVAHISTRYGNGDTTGMDAVGSEITLDRVRVEIAGEVTDFPLAGEPAETPAPADEPDTDAEVEPMEASGEQGPASVTAAVDEPDTDPEPALAVSGARMTNLAAASDAAAVIAEAIANAPQAPPGAWFAPIAVDGPTPPTINAQGRVWGHIGQSGVCHVGIRDECVEIPQTRTNYGAFHRDQVVTAEGDTVQVGYLYTGCDHSDLRMELDEARDYLDAACTRTAVGRVHDTEYGPLFTGAVMPAVTAEAVARLHKLSGEWFTAPLELHAAVGVTDAGFPVSGTGEEIRVSDEDPAPIVAAADPDPGASAEPAPAPVVGVDEAGPVDQAEQVDRARVIHSLDRHIMRAAMRTAGPVVAAARRNRAARDVARYTRRGV